MPKTILITGATGNLGSRVLVRFLEDQTLRFVLLVYAPHIDDARHQVQQSIEFWGGSWEHVSDRIQIVLGNITQEDLGLTPEVRATMVRSVTHIIHCAANFKLNLPLEDARLSIVRGTEHLVRLAEDCREHGHFIRFNYISTEEVGISLTGLVTEDFLPVRSQRSYFNTYEFAKAEAEELLHERMLRTGFPVTIYRPAIIVGDSKTGRIINAQGFYYIIRDMFLKPASPVIPMNDQFQIDVIPVDALAQALYVMYTAPETEGRVYHLGCGKNRFLTLRELLSSLQHIHQTLTGTRIPLKPFVPPRIVYGILMLATAVTWGATKEALQFQLDFLKFFFVKATLDTTALDTFLLSKGQRIPALSEYLPTLYAYYIEHNPTLATLSK